MTKEGKEEVILIRVQKLRKEKSIFLSQHNNIKNYCKNRYSDIFFKFHLTCDVFANPIKKAVHRTAFFSV